MSYSQDFRRQVLKSINSDGMTVRQAAAFYGISPNTITLWKRNGITPKKGVYKPRKISNEALLQDVTDYPDAYHAERAARFGVTPQAVCIALKRLKVSLKKDLRPSETKT